MDTVIHNFLYRAAAEIANNAQDTAPVITRNLRNDIKVHERGRHEFAVGNSKLAAYALYVHEGTGIYGPKKRKIVPKNAKALRFKAGGRVIYRRSVKGQKPNRYLKRAVDDYLNSGQFDDAAKTLTVGVSKEIIDNIKANLSNIVIEI